VDAPTIVLGLGNPGEPYRDTRHNLGFRVIDALAARAGLRLAAEGEWRRYAKVARGTAAGGADVVLAQPRTWMNRSGRAAAALCRAFEVAPRDLLVVHDDADLELGRIRVRRGGSSGGHNGLRSLFEVLGDGSFIRIRLGVRGTGREGEDLADYVLRPFDPDERPVAERLVGLGADAAEHLLREGLDATMNRFNGRVAGSVGIDPMP